MDCSIRSQIGSVPVPRIHGTLRLSVKAQCMSLLSTTRFGLAQWCWCTRAEQENEVLRTKSRGHTWNSLTFKFSS
jgi:hypothetical protein